MPFTKQLNALYEAFHESGIECKRNEPMASHTSFDIGGEAALTVWPASRAQLVQVLSFWRSLGEKCPLCVLGKGSNILFPDHGFHGLVVITTRAKRVVFEEDEAPDREVFRREHLYCQVYAECGASLTALAYTCGYSGRALSGLEFAYGIPGTVGGGLFMNAGAFGGNISDVVVSSICYDPTNDCIRKIDLDEHEFKYRESIYSKNPHLIILAVMLELAPGRKSDIISQMNKNVRTRKEKQPLEYPSAGSVFKRPVGYYAGEMIEKSGLKGYRIGGAEVSEKHAGFIINRGNATADDVMSLIDHIKKTVYDNYEVELECEVRYIEN